MSEPLLVLFDIDGTLVNTSGAGRRALVRAYEEVFGIPDAFAGYSFSGTTDLHIVRTAFLRNGGLEPTEERIALARSAYMERLTEEMKRGCAEGSVVVFPGVYQILDALDAQRIPVGLATGNFEEGAREKLVPVGLWQRFSFGGFGSDYEHRGMLTQVGVERGLKKHGVPFEPDRIWVVGDSPLDIKAARYVGVRVLAVATGIHPVDELAGHHPDAVVQDLGDTSAVLKLLTSPRTPISCS